MKKCRYLERRSYPKSPGECGMERKTLETWPRNGQKGNSVKSKRKTKQKTTGEAEGKNCLVARTFEIYSEDLVLNSASAICTMHDFAT